MRPEDLYGTMPEDVYGKSPDDIYGTTENEEKPSAMEYIANEAKKGIGDFSSLAGHPLDAMVKIASWFDRLSGGEGNVPEHFFADAARVPTDKALGVKEMHPPSDESRYAGSVARFATGSLPTAGFATIAAPTKIGKITAATTEGVSALGGGIGSELGADIAEEFDIDQSKGRLAGGLLGAMTPLATSTAVNEALSRFRTLKSDEFNKTLGKNKAAAQLQQEIKNYPEAERNLAESEALRENIPGFSPSLGRSTGAPGIISLENKLARHNSENLKQAIVSDQISREAILNKMNATFKEGANIMSAPAITYRKVVSELEGKLNNITMSRKDIANQFMRKPAADIGKRLREIRNKEQAVVRDVKNAKYEKVYDTAERLGIKENMDDIYSMVKEMQKDPASKYQDMPVEIKKFIDKYDNPVKGAIVDVTGNPLNITPKDVSFRELHSLMRATNKGLRMAEMSGNSDTAYYLSQMKKTLENKVARYEGTEFGEIATDLKDANSFFVDKYQKVFKEGVGGKMARFGRMGELTDDAEVVQKLFLGTPDGIKDFFKIYGKSDESYHLLTDGILDIFAKEQTKNGMITANGVSNFVNKYYHQLNGVPGLKKIFEDTGALNQALINRQAIIKNKITKFHGSRLKTLEGATSVDNLLEKALSSKENMQALRNSLKRKEGGLDSLAHSIAVKVSRMKDPYQYILDNEEILKTTLDKIKIGHFQSLKTLAQANKVLNRSHIHQGVDILESITDPLQQKFGTSVKSVFSQFRAAAQGRVSQEYVISDIGGKYLFKIKQEEANRILQSAFYDPVIAKDLAQSVVDLKFGKTLANRMQDHLFSVGAKTNIMINQSQEEDEEF